MSIPALIEPLVPADCDCRGLKFMPLDVITLCDSDLVALSTGDEFKAAVILWCKSWLQLPAASLPDNERVLARLAGVSLQEWASIREMAMHGWIKCSDGRLYHPVVAEKALSAFSGRPESVKRGLAGAATKWAVPVADAAPRPIAGMTRSQRLAAARAIATHTAEEWKAMLDVCGPCCLRCGQRAKLIRDHIVPIYQGGSDGIDNLQPFCLPCNSAKGPDNTDFRPVDWRKRLSERLQNAIERLRDQHDAWQGTGTGRETGDIGSPPNGDDLARSHALDDECFDGEFGSAPMRDDFEFPKDAFETWWQTYPHKVGKDYARKCFESVRKKRMVRFDQLMDGVAAYIAAKPPDRPWANPSTWINQGRWTDEPAPQSGGGYGQQSGNSSKATSRPSAHQARVGSMLEGAMDALNRR